MNTTRTGSRALVRAILLAVLLVQGINAAETGEVLYNGIVLPREWPPLLADFPTSVEKDPANPPYLVSPPALIPIDAGRQLFVDDFRSTVFWNPFRKVWVYSIRHVWSETPLIRGAASRGGARITKVRMSSRQPGGK
jgi:hypothetical protein